jgi:PAS domain S-box-containing protein
MADEQGPGTDLAPKIPLRVLLVEDNSDDAELCIRILRRAQFEVHFDIVKMREEFTNRLRTANFDVILTDYNLGSWTGTETLELLYDEGQDVPVILVTGALGDQKAVECIKSGISDYVLKDRMERLPLAISRALEERASRVERQQTGRLIKESEAKFRALADAIPTAVFIEQGTQCCYVNRAAAQLTGYSHDELLTMNFWQLVLPGSRKGLLEATGKNAESNRPCCLYKARILTKKGEVRFLTVTVGMFHIDGGLAALITASDMAEQRHTVGSNASLGRCLPFSRLSRTA